MVEVKSDGLDFRGGGGGGGERGWSEAAFKCKDKKLVQISMKRE